MSADRLRQFQVTGVLRIRVRHFDDRCIVLRYSRTDCSIVRFRRRARGRRYRICRCMRVVVWIHYRLSDRVGTYGDVRQFFLRCCCQFPLATCFIQRQIRSQGEARLVQVYSARCRDCECYVRCRRRTRMSADRLRQFQVTGVFGKCVRKLKLSQYSFINVFFIGKLFAGIAVYVLANSSNAVIIDLCFCHYRVCPYRQVGNNSCLIFFQNDFGFPVHIKSDFGDTCNAGNREITCYGHTGRIGMSIRILLVSRLCQRNFKCKFIILICIAYNPLSNAEAFTFCFVFKCSFIVSGVLKVNS